jgi:hypothetical protein
LAFLDARNTKAEPLPEDPGNQDDRESLDTVLEKARIEGRPPAWVTAGPRDLTLGGCSKSRGWTSEARRASATSRGRRPWCET